MSRVLSSSFSSELARQKLQFYYKLVGLYQWTHWISNLRERQSAYSIVLARRRTQSQCSSSSSSRERATNHIATRPNISSSVHFASRIAKLSFYCLEVKDQNCCIQSRFTSSGRRPTKMRLWPGICPGPCWESLQRSQGRERRGGDERRQQRRR